PCQKCGGTGRIRKRRKIKVTIPAGIDEGQMLTLRGEGEPGLRGGPNGDLYIVIHVKPHEIFRREGYDVYVKIPISFADAALGGEIKIPTLDGVVSFTIPEGTQTGSKFKLRGKGIPHIGGRGRGDQIVEVYVEVPKRLTEKQRELLKEWKKLEGESPSEHKSFFQRMKDAFGGN
ncbi:MAG: DnaJ C-terminal domain-containing protein, partial [Caldanaerobacter sp.]